MSSKQFEYPSSSSESESESENESCSDSEKSGYIIHPSSTPTIKRDFIKRKEMKKANYFVHNYQVKK